MKTQNGGEEVRKKKGKGFENGGGGREKENGKMEREGRANQDWDGFKISKTFWLRALQHRRALASRENSRGKMAPAQRDTENA